MCYKTLCETSHWSFFFCFFFFVFLISISLYGYLIIPGTVNTMVWYRNIESLKNINTQLLWEYKKIIQVEAAVCRVF